MIDLDKLALELQEEGDAVDAELIIRRPVEGGIETKVITFTITKDDYQWAINTKRLPIKGKFNE